MRRCMTMQCLLPIAVVLLAAHTASARRVPLQTGNPIATTNNQHIQFTVAIKGKTCAELKDGGDLFSDSFRAAMRQDAIDYLTSQGQTEAVSSLKAAAGGCGDIFVSCVLLCLDLARRSTALPCFGTAQHCNHQVGSY